MLTDSITRGLGVFELAILGYFLALNTLYLAFCVVAYVRLQQHRRRWTARDLDAIMRSPATPAISIVAPAYNEEATLADSVRSLLLLNYPQFEVIVVSNGSTDGTLAVGVKECELVRAPVSYDQSITTEPVRGVYQSLAHPELVMIDKENALVGYEDDYQPGAARFDVGERSRSTAARSPTGHWPICAIWAWRWKRLTGGVRTCSGCGCRPTSISTACRRA